MSECELCYKVIIREMSIFDWDAYCDVVEKEFNDIPRVCDTCAYRALFMYYHEKFKKVIKITVLQSFKRIQMMSIITIVYAVSISTESIGKEIKWLVTPKVRLF